MSAVEECVPLKPVYMHKAWLGLSSAPPALEHQIASRRCLRCGKYYTEKDNTVTSCSFHAGEYGVSYSSSNMAGVTVGHWMCCKQPDKTSAPCMVDRHLEDARTSEALDEFKMAVVKASGQRGGNGPIYPNLDNTESPKEQKGDSESEEIEPEASIFFEYVVQSNDTLPGIALKFNMKPAEVMRLNKLWSATAIHSKRILLIPTGNVPDGYEHKTVPLTSEQREMKEKVIRRALVEEFAAKEKTSIEEATYYLAERNWIPAAAKEARDEDVMFEMRVRK